MKNYVVYFLVAVVSLSIGYFAGREHIKYEMRSAFSAAAESFSTGFRSKRHSGKEAADRKQDAIEADKSVNEENQKKSKYAAEFLDLYDFSAEYRDSMLDGKVPGVLFKIKNNGDRTLSRVEVTVYFSDAQGNVIAEEDYTPVLVSDYSFSGDNKPLKPGYIWQMERGKFYSAKNVPSEWQDGSAKAAITNIEFAE
ncbi:hypothetical protein [Salinisphaera sp.]|uniref:hypothetical protein n=1 Tax=Salinisphaera sp. TaxID=1914330 RepID=UPI000C490B6A|nr:hypothetical protein [Salinisphaera sp.]MBS61782.1 hypothetical protein [Salinisphaera sp.]